MQYRSHRYPTEYPVTIRTSSGAQLVTVIDVNTQGARLRGVQHVSKGDKIVFTILSHQAMAVVRWVGHDKVGVTFRPMITDHQVDTLRYRQDSRLGGHLHGFGARLPVMR